MPSSTLGKITAGIAGTTGTGGLGVTGFGVFRVASAHAVSGSVWAAGIALTVVAGLVSALGLILEYKLKKLHVEERGKEAQSDAELQKTRLEIHRGLVEKAAGEPGSAQSYRELILANALHLSVEQNGTQPADRTHGRLYGSQVAQPDPGMDPPTTQP